LLFSRGHCECCSRHAAQVYGRPSAGLPPYAVGVAHFEQDAEQVAAFLFSPDNMGSWNDELCEKGTVRHLGLALHLLCVALTHAACARC
jgi:hypothetical protein